MRYLSNYAVAHAAVLSLIAGVFLVDGCAHRAARPGTQAASPPASASARPAEGMRNPANP